MRIVKIEGSRLWYGEEDWNYEDFGGDIIEIFKLGKRLLIKANCKMFLVSANKSFKKNHNIKLKYSPIKVEELEEIRSF